MNGWNGVQFRLSERIIYEILQELGGVDVPMKAIREIVRERYPSLDVCATRRLFQLYRSYIVSRKYLGAKSGFSYTIIGNL